MNIILPFCLCGNEQKTEQREGPCDMPAELYSVAIFIMLFNIFIVTKLEFVHNYSTMTLGKRSTDEYGDDIISEATLYQPKVRANYCGIGVMCTLCILIFLLSFFTALQLISAT